MNRHRSTQCERVLELLFDYRWHSTRELMDKTGITRISGRIYDLKRKGRNVASRETRIDGVRWEEYRLVPSDQPVHDSPLLRELRGLKEGQRPSKRVRQELAVEGQPKLSLFDLAKP
jgi:biotin operon repressor